MNKKDKATIAISIIALMISIAATINSEVKSQYEKKRILKSQLTDVLSRINKLNIENAKLFKEIGKTDPEYFQTLSAMYNQENGFLLQQAMLLSKQIPELVSDIEYNTIALANFNTGDFITAEEYYLKAIDSCHDNYYSALAMKSYAMFLFQIMRYEQGREYFKNAISLLNNNDNRDKYTRGTIYQAWAFNEMAIGSSQTQIQNLLSNAEMEYSGIDNEILRSNAMQGLSATRNRSTGSLPFSW